MSNARIVLGLSLLIGLSSAPVLGSIPEVHKVAMKWLSDYNENIAKLGAILIHGNKFLGSDDLASVEKHPYLEMMKGTADIIAEEIEKGSIPAGELTKLKSQVELLRDKVQGLRAAITPLTQRIASSSSVLFSQLQNQYTRTFREHADLAARPDEAYSYLELKKEDREKITDEMIAEKEDVLSKRYPMNSREWRRVRQANYFLQEFYSRQNYNAYLDFFLKTSKSGLEHILISPAQASNHKLDLKSIADLQTVLITFKNMGNKIIEAIEDKLNPAEHS